MRRLFLTLLLGAALAAPASAQTRPAEGRRAELEARIFDRFVQMSAQRLQLASDQRARYEATLEEYAAKRRELGRRGAQLHRDLVRALESEATSEAEFRRILGSLEQLREDERRIWQAEKAALDRILTPRQQAQLVMLRARMIERVNDIRSRPGPGRGSGRRMPPGP